MAITFNKIQFFPDATHCCIKGVASDDVTATKTTGLVVNTYHILADELVDTIKDAGGIHKFMKYENTIISDSGGFQVMSLVRKSPENGKITDEGITFKLEGVSKNTELTPESCIDTQLSIASDIIMNLDDCTYPGESQKEQELSVKRTVNWAKRCKSAYNNSVKEKPLIFGIVQGGNSKELRKTCAQELIDIGFDGYAYGGWPVDSDRRLLSEILEFTAHAIPNDKVKYAMGVGKPENIVECVKYGYNLFDCVLPTRDARHKRLYIFKNDIKNIDLFSENFYDYLYIGSGKYKNDFQPLSSSCDCLTCAYYSRAYLYHLFKVNDPLAIRLATIHNLRFYSMLMEEINKRV